MPSSAWRIAPVLTTTAILLACPTTGRSQSAANDGGEAFELPPITLMGDRQGRAVSDLPASIAVVGGDEIEARGLNDMQEITRYLPGITVPRQTSGTDPFNTFGGFNIRGVGGNRVQMQVDGSRVAERIMDGTRDYLDFNFTKQVDVVRGPASVLWGADALGGVVAVETIDPEDVLDGRARGGTARLSFDGLNDEIVASASFAQQVGPTLSLMFGIARTEAKEAEFSNARADGGIYGCPRNIAYGATPCNKLDPTEISATRVLAKAVWTPSAAHRLEFSVDRLDRETDVQYDNVLGPVFSMMTGLPTGEVINNYDRTLDIERTRIAVEHTWQAGLGWVDEVKTTLAFVPHGYDRKGVKSSISAAGDDVITEDYLSFSEDFVELDIQATSRFTVGGADHELTWGFDGDHTETDYSRRNVVRNITQGTVTEKRAGGFNFANADTRRADIYVQDRITLMDGALELSPGLRFATYKIDPRPDNDYQVVPGSEPRSRKDEALLASLGALYRFGDGWQLWGHYGEGFKMPTAQQLYTSLPGTFFDLIPAPDLKPEEVESIEIGLRREMAEGAFGVTLFNADYTNFIESFFEIKPNTYTYRNLSEVRVWGVEIEGEWDIRPDLRLSGAASWQKGNQRASAGGAKTPRTLPPATAVLGLSWDVPDSAWTFDVVGTFAAGVTETAGPDDFKPAGYGVIDGFASWDVTDRAVLNLGVKNLFDKRYFQASAAGYSATAPNARTARANPIELQTGPGRVFTASLEVKF